VRGHVVLLLPGHWEALGQHLQTLFHIYLHGPRTRIEYVTGRFLIRTMIYTGYWVTLWTMISIEDSRMTTFGHEKGFQWTFSLLDG
jgi:hypothetical protein